MQYADRLSNVETSAIRELFKILGTPGITSFAGGFPDSDLFDVEGIKAACVRALEEAPGSALQYGATEGYEPLRRELSKLMKTKGVTAESNELIVTTGSQQALDLIGKVLISPGDRVVVEAPTFLSAIQCFRLYGAELVGAPIDENGVLPDQLESLIVKHRPKFIYLIPTFGNPSGATLSLERRKKILEIAVKHNTVVVEDDPYSDLYFNAPPPPAITALTDAVAGSRELLVYCGSLSKVMSPGLRLGWMMANKEFLSKAVMCKQFSDAHTSTFSQATATQYLKSGRLPDAIRQVRDVYSERASVMAGSLERELSDTISFARPSGGMFFWARLTGAHGHQKDAREFSKRAIEHRVAFVPGAPFFANAPDLATLRLSFASTNLDLIQDGVTRLGHALRAG